MATDNFLKPGASRIQCSVQHKIFSINDEGKIEYHYKDNENFVDIEYVETEVGGLNPSLIDVYNLKFNNGYGSVIETKINILGISDISNPIITQM